MLISYVLFGCLGFLVIVSIPLGYRMCITAFGRRPVNTNDGVYGNNRVANRNRNLQLGENVTSIELATILAKNNLVINNYKFIVCTGEQTKVSKKGFNSIFFNETCILQGKYVTLNSKSFYYEIELMDFTDTFELLFGYADRSTSEIHGKLMFLVLVLQIC
ncbi:hypothetical protein K502DRAFT_353942 [Neoconidiobolus thromboides FSU 785]|nr:hypothetical protein K502DRAFT_353942 [Neoconidiobolus thromboides FSU 785]